MGTFTVPIEIGDAEGRQFQPLEALVDTGATCLVVPGDILASLGVEPMEARSFQLANGETVQYQVGVVSLRLEGRTFPTLCVFSDRGSEPLLGGVALETFQLAPDPVNQVLIPVRGKLMGQLVCTNLP